MTFAEYPGGNAASVPPEVSRQNVVIAAGTEEIVQISQTPETVFIALSRTASAELEYTFAPSSSVESTAAWVTVDLDEVEVELTKPISAVKITNTLPDAYTPEVFASIEIDPLGNSFPSGYDRYAYVVTAPDIDNGQGGTTLYNLEQTILNIQASDRDSIAVAIVAQLNPELLAAGSSVTAVASGHTILFSGITSFVGAAPIKASGVYVRVVSISDPVEGDEVSISISGLPGLENSSDPYLTNISGLVDQPITVSYTVLNGEGAADVAQGLVNAINGDPTLSGASITSTVVGSTVEISNFPAFLLGTYLAVASDGDTVVNLQDIHVIEEATTTVQHAEEIPHSEDLLADVFSLKLR